MLGQKSGIAEEKHLVLGLLGPTLIGCPHARMLHAPLAHALHRCEAERETGHETDETETENCRCRT